MGVTKVVHVDSPPHERSVGAGTDIRWFHRASGASRMSIIRDMASADELELACAAISRAWRQRVDEGTMSPGTASRYRRVFSSFVAFQRSSGTTGLGMVDTSACVRFIGA